MPVVIHGDSIHDFINGINYYSINTSMRIHEIINEGMSFGPAKKITKNGETYITGEEWQSKQDVECPFCHGKGYDEYHGKREECGYCYGKGHTNDWVSSAPELDVSNANGHAIQAMLGLDPDYTGHIENKDLPGIMQKLIRLKNQRLDQYTQDTIVDEPGMQRLPDNHGVARIGRNGPTMIHGGRTHAQVERYVDKLIEIVKFAQQNNADISWG